MWFSNRIVLYEIYILEGGPSQLFYLHKLVFHNSANYYVLGSLNLSNVAEIDQVTSESGQNILFGFKMAPLVRGDLHASQLKSNS